MKFNLRQANDMRNLKEMKFGTRREMGWSGTLRYTLASSEVTPETWNQRRKFFTFLH